MVLLEKFGKWGFKSVINNFIFCMYYGRNNEGWGLTNLGLGDTTPFLTPVATRPWYLATLRFRN